MCGYTMGKQAGRRRQPISMCGYTMGKQSEGEEVDLY